MGTDCVIRIEPQEKEVTGKEGETVLEALMREFYGREGRTGFYGCRRGGCGACKMQVVSGEVNHDSTYSRAALTDEERTRGYILACRSRLQTNIVIRIPKRKSRLGRYRIFDLDQHESHQSVGGVDNG
ncbi:2Fe-2S iron-sulfur cluster-binding protein [Kyrpidia spormannii]|uniref:Ferredoxin n=2 Tax=Kyrpidia spormannii TaxID=2055160 RepID=A0ACA8ZAL5_9BACL|nr:2Fe-2S iron-sulfur cluster-binding protein [Kyrpidia spormannii]CAB3393617.1 Ferredoxin [Kyrpidia spormannii]CAB3394537.1 Ferredoxin [Kyrpidia spormannii]